MAFPITRHPIVVFVSSIFTIVSLTSRGAALRIYIYTYVDKEPIMKSYSSHNASGVETQTPTGEDAKQPILIFPLNNGCKNNNKTCAIASFPTEHVIKANSKR